MPTTLPWTSFMSTMFSLCSTMFQAIFTIIIPICQPHFRKHPRVCVCVCHFVAWYPFRVWVKIGFTRSDVRFSSFQFARATHFGVDHPGVTGFLEGSHRNPVRWTQLEGSEAWGAERRSRKGRQKAEPKKTRGYQGPPVVPFYQLVWGRVPLLNRLQEKGDPDSNLSTGGPSRAKDHRR